MKKVGKKTVALILALTMAMSLMSVTAWARYGSDTDDDEGIQTLSARSGTFGTNLQYELDENGVLTISVVDGATSGTMDNYTEESPSPFADADDINYIIIEEGCTNIGDYAFAGCRYISFVLIPASVRSIGEWAFKDDKVYTTLTLVFMGDAPYLSDSCFWQHELIVYYPMNTEGWLPYEYWDEVGKAISAIWYLYDPATITGESELTYAFSDGLLTISGSGTVARGDLYTYLTSVGVDGSAVEGIEIDNSSGNITISYSAFTDCRKGIKAFIFIGDPPTFEPYCMRLISAQAYYPGYISSWRSAVRSNYGGTLTWIDYEGATTTQDKLFQWNPSSGGTSKMIMHIYDMDGNNIFSTIRPSNDGISISSDSSITSGNKTNAWVVDIEGFVQSFLSGSSDYEFKYATITDPNIGNATAIANGYYNPTYYKGNVSGFQQFGSSANSVTSVQIYGYNDQSSTTKNWEYTITTAAGKSYVVDLFGNANGGTADSKWSPYNLNINFYFDEAEEETCNHGKTSYTGPVAATCTENGKQGYYTCGYCGKLFSDQACTNEVTEEDLIIPATGHGWDISASDTTVVWTGDDINDYTGCTATIHCQNGCGETQTIECTVDPDTGIETTPATCTEPAKTVYTATSTSGSSTGDNEETLTQTGTLTNTIFYNWNESTKTITIWGTGSFTAYDYTSTHKKESPLAEYTTAEYIIVKEGITEIWSDPFYGLNSLKQVVLPDGMNYIGNDAFSDCGGGSDGYIIYFEGSAPAGESENSGISPYAIWFPTSNVTIYYPENDSSWNSYVGNSFGATDHTVTWQSYTPGETSGSGSSGSSSGLEATFTKEVESGSALGHLYDENNVTFSWSGVDDLTSLENITGVSCTATFTCTDCSTETTVNCTVAVAAGSSDTLVATATITSREGDVTATNEYQIEVGGHTHEWGTSEWTWTEDGKGNITAITVTRSCSGCDATETASQSDANLTLYDETVTSAATCTEAGTMHYMASVTWSDGDTRYDTYDATIPALGHQYDAANVTFSWSGVDDLTSLSDLTGVTCTATFTCTACSTETAVDCTVAVKTGSSDTLVATATIDSREGTVTATEEKTIEVATHTHTWDPDASDTVVSWGDYTSCTVTLTCREDDCNETLVIKCSVTSETTPATCETAGQTVYTATGTETDENGQEVSVTVEKTVQIPALGHDYDDGVVTEEPTCTEKGEKIYTCSRGDDSYTKEIDALGHDWDWDSGVVSKAADYGEPGDITYPCSRCDATYTDVGVIPVLTPYFDVMNETPSEYVTAAIGDNVELDAHYELDVTVLNTGDLDEGLIAEVETAALAAVTEMIESGEYELSEPFWLEIDLLKWLDSENYETIDESWFEITITVPIPEELLGADNYVLVRMHDGAAEVLEAAADEDNVTVTFTTDLFSVYALYALNEAEIEDNTGTEDDDNTDPTIPNADDDEDDDGTGEDLDSTDEGNIEEPGSTDESDSGAAEDTGSTVDDGNTDDTETDDAEAPGDTDSTEDTGGTDNTGGIGSGENESTASGTPADKDDVNETDATEKNGGNNPTGSGSTVVVGEDEDEDAAQTVDEDDSGKDNPKTDDTQMPYLMLTIFLLAIAGFAVLFVCELHKRSFRRR